MALNILNIKLDDGSYFFPSSGTTGYRQASFSSPAIYNSDQELANGDYVIIRESKKIPKPAAAAKK